MTESSSAARWSQLESLFDGALEQPAGERAAWLRAHCTDDALRDEVTRMLAAHERVEGILDRPVGPPGEHFDLAGHMRQALSGRYTIEREIGRGGMATVYLAREEKHARKVVIKVLKPEAALACGADRFLREVHIAAQLSHPHILGLIDSGEANGLLFYVMPFVEGQTLRDRLLREGSIDLPDAIGLLRDIADALAYAHGAGVVHRDLKPENVFCVGGHAFLLDFGVAKLIPGAEAGQDDQSTMTAQGVVIGTPAYMAPEQKAGLDDVDERADLYAWGLIAHEMLTGDIPLTPTGERVNLTQLADLRGTVPDDLLELIAQCLQISRSRRPSDARAVVAFLEGLVTPTPTSSSGRWPRYSRHARWRWGLVAVGVGAIVAGVLWRMGGAAATAVAMPVAVAALDNETGDTSLTTWGRLAGDWITQGLQETGLVTVVPWPTALQASERISAARLDRDAVDPVAVMRAETRARTVVTGTYYRVGDELRFQVEVTDAESGRLLGAPPPVVVPADSPQVAVQQLRDRLMATVAIWSDERLALIPGITQRPPTFAAYRAFDDGLEQYLAQDYRRGAETFREAYALDTTFVVSLIYAAVSYWNSGQIDRTDSLLSVLRGRRGELSEYHEQWVEYFDAALVGEGERALAAMRRASTLAPGSKATYNLALAALNLNRPREALTALEQLDPDRGPMRGWSSYWTQLSHAYHLLARHRDELEAARGLRVRYPSRRVGWVLEARALAALEQTDRLDSLLDAATALPPNTYWSQGAAMVVAGEELLAHGDRSVATRYLEQGVDWLTNQLAATPTNRSHRYWLGSALYDLTRWEEAAAQFFPLAQENADQILYRGLGALAAARVNHPRAPDEWLGTPLPHQTGDQLAYRARIAAIAGDTEAAVSLLIEALRHGVDGYAWFHGYAFRDLATLRGDPRFEQLRRGGTP